MGDRKNALYAVLITVSCNVCFPLFVYNFNVVIVLFTCFPSFVVCLAVSQRRNEVYVR